MTAMTAKSGMPPPKRLRIAVLNRTFAPTGGGAERYSIALVEQLAARHEIHVFAQQIDHHWPGVTYHRVSMPLRKPRWVNQLWYATATWWATRERKGRGFDVVHSHENTWHGNVQTVHVLPVWHNLFQGRTGFRRALRWLSVVTSPRLWTYLGLESLRFGRTGRSVVVTSDSLCAVMATTFPACASTLTVLVPGVDAPETVASAAERQSARTVLGLPQDASCLLLVGNDYRKKGLQSMLDALGLLSKRNSSAVLAVVGNTAHKAQFEAQVQRLGLVDRVFFLGPLSDVTPAYHAADVLVHPTLEDTFAMVVLEAMAQGLPVVVSCADYCGISGLLSNTHNALLLSNPHDASALAQAVDQALNDAPLRQTLIANAREFALSHAWPEKARQQEAIYFAVAGKIPSKTLV